MTACHGPLITHLFLTNALAFGESVRSVGASQAPSSPFRFMKLFSCESERTPCCPLLASWLTCSLTLTVHITSPAPPLSKCTTKTKSKRAGKFRCIQLVKQAASRREGKGGTVASQLLDELSKPASERSWTGFKAERLVLCCTVDSRTPMEVLKCHAECTLESEDTLFGEHTSINHMSLSATI